MELYREAIDALLRKWDSSRLIERDKFYKNLSYTRREHLLETIAASFYFDSKTVFARTDLEAVVAKFLRSLPDKDINGEADSGGVIRAIEAQHGLIVERAVGVYSFSHLTVQEFFTASFIVKSSSDVLLRQIVRSALLDQKWREVMLYTLGLLPSADSILSEMSSQLAKMKGGSTGVLSFLTFCYCDSRIRSRRPDQPEPHLGRYSLSELRDDIQDAMGNLRHPALTSYELAKVVEHFEGLSDFLRVRSQRYQFGDASAIVESALGLLKGSPLDSAKLLGGYFFRPEDFLRYLYGCRLFVECLEVAITSRRTEFTEQILSISVADVEVVRRGTPERKGN